MNLKFDSKNTYFISIRIFINNFLTKNEMTLNEIKFLIENNNDYN